MKINLKQHIMEISIATMLVITGILLYGNWKFQNRLWNGLLLAVHLNAKLDPGEAVYVFNRNLSVVNASSGTQTITPWLAFWTNVAWEDKAATKPVSIVLENEINPESSTDQDYLLPLTFSQGTDVVVYYVDASTDPNFGIMTALFYVRHAQNLTPVKLPESDWTLAAAGSAWDWTATVRRLSYEAYASNPFGYYLEESGYADRLQLAENIGLPIK